MRRKKNLYNRMAHLRGEVLKRFNEGTWQKEAALYLSDKKKMRSLLGLLLTLFHRRALGPMLKDLVLLYYYVRDIVEKRYTAYSRRNLLLVVAVLIYVVSPIDVIPDFLAGVGFLDDAFLVGYVIRLADAELQKYYAWSKARTRRDKDLTVPDGK
ncbi:MAG: DUF1232 domain-containing protein [Bacteroidaceae bacterium]|nr:DUF1232 domain-containing protein [Bacteroidaceae bacterium]